MGRSISRRTFTTGTLAAGLLTVVGSPRASSAPEAVTRQGPARGFMRNGAAVFLGLPYGADTSGANRFRPPLPPTAWDGIRDASKPGQRAPQPVNPPPPDDFMNYFTGGRADERAAIAEPMGENCLVLNVVTPSPDRRARPVLFYIHGGGFTSGSGLVMTFADRFVAREDVVVVTVNHRLGALGFMYLGGISPELADGNPGMLDLVAGLRWVRDNIAAFGGDPTNVTIYGESGGGAKVGLLLAMPQATGLFSAAIIESGLLPEPVPPDRATAATRAFIARLGVEAAKTAPVRDLGRTPFALAELRSAEIAPKTTPTLAALRALPFERLVGPETPGSRPVADGRTLTARPWARAPETAAEVPLIIGYCKDELTLFSLGEPSLFALQWPDVRGRLHESVSLPAAAAEQVVSAYRAAFPQDDPSDCYFRISSDATFGRAMVTMADRKAAQRPPVYFYRMEFDTRLPPDLRAIHTAELPMTVDLNWRPESAVLSKQISGAWAAFARTGNPNHAGLPTWHRYNPQENRSMIFDTSSRSGPDPQAAPRAVLFDALAGVPQWNPL